MTKYDESFLCQQFNLNRIANCKKNEFEMKQITLLKTYPYKGNPRVGANPNPVG